jgi:hypothetical protein
MSLSVSLGHFRAVHAPLREGPLLAELRSPVGSIERLIWRKLTLKLDEPAAKTDPNRILNFLKNTFIPAQASIF